jgi:tRNA G37 N-methylase Trm5
MNLPSEAIGFMDAAAQAVKPDGGIIHFYTFAARPVDLETVKKSVADTLEKCGRHVGSIPFCRAIREIAPGRVHVAIDIKLE